MRQSLGPCTGRVPGLILPLAAAAACGVALLVDAGAGQRLAAGTTSGSDYDLDLLTNVQEQVLTTSATHADSDADGFGDLEELARGTSPVCIQDVPSGQLPLHLGMTASGGADGNIHVLVAMHAQGVSLRDTRLEIGFQVGRRMEILSTSWIAAHSTWQVAVAADGVGLISLLDIAFDPTPIHQLGQLTLFASGWVAGSGSVTTADTLRLLSIDGIVVLQQPPQRPVAVQQGTGPVGTGSVFTPLPTGGGGLPATWSAGEICFQRSSPVAVSGAVVTQEVVSAECLNGWDGYCPPTCSSSVGSTYVTVDPVGLIGG